MVVRFKNGMGAKGLILPAALAFIILLGMLSPALASVGRFVVIKGRVDVLKPGQTRALEAKVDDAVSPGDIIRAKSDSFAEVVFTDNSNLKIAENTRVQVKDFVVNANGKRESGTLRLLRGKIRATVPKTLGSLIPVSSSKSSFEVETPTAVAGVRGTDFIIVFAFGSTHVYVIDGTVDTWNILFPDDPVRITRGRFTYILYNEPPVDPQWMRAFERSMLERDISGAGNFRLVSFEGGDASGSFDTPQAFASNLLDRPVTETNTSLLSGSTFNGSLSSSAFYLTLSGTMSGNYSTASHTWTATITGTFSDLLTGTQSWSGTFSGTDSNGQPVAADIGVQPPLCDCGPLGTWTNGSVAPGTWSSPISGTHQNGTFSGTISGTTSGGSAGTFSGTGSGTW